MDAPLCRRQGSRVNPPATTGLLKSDITPLNSCAVISLEGSMFNRSCTVFMKRAFKLVDAADRCRRERMGRKGASITKSQSAQKWCSKPSALGRARATWQRGVADLRDNPSKSNQVSTAGFFSLKWPILSLSISLFSDISKTKNGLGHLFGFEMKLFGT